MEKPRDRTGLIVANAIARRAVEEGLAAQGLQAVDQSSLSAEAEIDSWLVVLSGLSDEQVSEREREGRSACLSAADIPVFCLGTLQSYKTYISALPQERQDFELIETPVRFSALARKMRMAVRIRKAGQDTQNIALGRFTFYPGDLRLESDAGKETVRLTEKERDILLFLYENRNRNVSRDRLMNAIWDYAEDAETHTLETHIYRLRQKIERDPARPDMLLTEESGYRLASGQKS